MSLEIEIGSRKEPAKYLKAGKRLQKGDTLINRKGRRAKSDRHETTRVDPDQLRSAIRDLRIVTEDGEPNRKAVAALLGLKDRRSVKRWLCDGGQRMSLYQWRILDAMKWRLIDERRRGTIGTIVSTADCEALCEKYLDEVREEVDRREALTAHSAPFKYR